MIDREVYASDDTYQKTFAIASKIATECGTEDEFNTMVTDQGLNKREMSSIREMSNYIAGLKNPRQIVRWTYNDDTEIGQVSSVFDLEDMFVVAVLTDAVDEGYPTLDNVKERIKQKVYNNLKGEYFSEKMLEYNGDLNKIRENMTVTDKQVDQLFFSSRNLPGFTSENEVIGSLFAMQDGEVSQPIIGTSAAFVIKINSITPAADITDYSSTITKLTSDFNQKVNQNAPYNALKESLDITDSRIDFY